MNDSAGEGAFRASRSCLLPIRRSGSRFLLIFLPKYMKKTLWPFLAGAGPAGRGIASGCVKREKMVLLQRKKDEKYGQYDAVSGAGTEPFRGDRT